MDSLYAGIGIRDITPAEGTPLWGYMGRQGSAQGILDPLYAKALAFQADSDAAVLVSLDLGRVPVDAVCDRIRARAAQAGAGQVFLTTTHTHHAPVMDENGAPYVDRIEALIGDAIEDALADLAPARVGTGRVEFDMAHNRRKILDDGSCVMLWRNEERIPTQPVDREATLVKLEREDGSPLALLVHFACHPVIMGPSNMEYSADYVGVLSAAVKEASGFECVFLQGATGDINPYLDKTPITQGGIEAMRSVGQDFASTVLDALPGIEMGVDAEGSVAFVQKPVEVGCRWDFNDPVQRDIYVGAHGGKGTLFSRYVEAMRSDLCVPLAVLLLNGDIALVGMPGEIFVEYQLALKARTSVKTALLCGYTNGYHAYFPTVRDAIAGGYGGTLASYVGLGAADRLTTEALVEIARLAGQDGRPCTPEDFRLVDA